MYLFSEEIYQYFDQVIKINIPIKTDGHCVPPEGILNMTYVVLWPRTHLVTRKQQKN